jgi:lysosomal acid lipase/cholesteryl ester hydrolase
MIKYGKYVLEIGAEIAISIGLGIFLMLVASIRIIIYKFYYNCPSKYLWILDTLYLHSVSLQKIFSFHLNGGKSFSTSIDDLAHECGLTIETHKVVTDDGYMLTLHRLKNNSCPHSYPVLVMHGLLQDSESMLCGGKKSLGYYLASRGYDVWLGNNRGNKYSNTHKSIPNSNRKFWDFCIDELGHYDVPSMTDYILTNTSKSKLAYIGFSQGSAQAFIAFSNIPKVCDKISIFIALGPAVRSPGMRGSILLSFIQSNSLFFQLVFGYRAMLPSVPIWQSILSPSLFHTTVRISMYYLFGWKCLNMSPSRSIKLFQHCYSNSSVKCVSHWFQAILSGGLGAFNHSHSTNNKAKPHQLHDISQIFCPVAIIYGEEDKLIDATVIPSIVKSCVFSHKEPLYEHLDMIWADTACNNIFPLVYNQLQLYCSSDPK